MDEPKYATLQQLIDAVKTGALDPATFRLTVDNDSIYAYTLGADDDPYGERTVRLFGAQVSLADVAVEHFRSLGLPAEHA